MKAGIKIGVLFLAIGYSIYSSQVEMGIAILLYYLVNFFLLRTLFKVKKETVFLYDLFFLIYGLLTLLTHMQLIKNPFDDFFVHNDAAWSFYDNTINRCLPLKWNELGSEILFNIAFADYALPSFNFAVIAKLGVAFGIVNLRLLLRAHIFSFIALVPPLMANITGKYGYDLKKVSKSIIIFCLCSYLFITSAIFTRDSYVTFAYFLAAYLILLPDCRFRLLKFVLVFLLALSSRPENGLLILIFFFGYYIAQVQRKSSFIIFIFLIVGAVGISLFIGDLIETTMDTVSRYNERAADENTGGLFSRFYMLPFPLNLIVMVAYMLIMPLPIDYYINYDGGSIFTLPFVISPFIMALVFLCALWYLFRNFKYNKNVSYLLLTSIISFCAITQGSPDLRRAFAAIPGLFLAYLLIKDTVPKRVVRFCRVLVWPIIIIINVFILIYLHS